MYNNTTADWTVGTQEQCKMALVHVERILRVKADLLNKPSKKRKTPRSDCFFVYCLFDTVPLGMVYGPSRWSWPTGLYWNGMDNCTQSVSCGVVCEILCSVWVLSVSGLLYTVMKCIRSVE